MRIKHRTLLALMAIMVLAGCGGPSVEVAPAAVPGIPVSHEPPRPPHIPRWKPYKPPVEWPAEGAAAFEVRKQRRLSDLEQRYAEVSLIPYACKAKNVWELSQAASVVDAAKQFVSNFGVNPALVLRVVQVARDMENQSAIEPISQAAVLALCEAYGA
jgi:hypothetical protein